MTDRNIFADDWRLTLRAHYIEVIRKQDTLTERTLENVMYEIGFTDVDLQELRVFAKATIRAEDMGDNFIPDAELVSYAEGFSVPTVFEEPITEESPYEEMPQDLIAEIVAEEEVEALAADADIEPELEGEVDDEADTPKDDSSPAQLSLF
ncbi:MAG: hypothetical protein H7175_27955 [Burkholderiales bacterium]|nr:hypothetical protein [Anaerolineae bacterium]